MIKNVIFRNRKKHCFRSNWKFCIFREILKFQGIHAIIEFQVFRFLFFLNFSRLEILIKIESKNIQLSLFPSFFRIGFIFSKLTEFLVTWHEPITWRRSRVSRWDHPGKRDTWSKTKISNFRFDIDRDRGQGNKPKV